jgi:putative transposase
LTAKQAPAVKIVFADTDPRDRRPKWERIADTLDASFPNVAAMMSEAKTDVVAFTAFLLTHWQKILVQPHRTARQENQAPR